MVVIALVAACGGAASAPELSTVGNALSGSAGGASAAPANPNGEPDSQAGPGKGTDDGNQVGARDDARIIRTGSMELEVTDVVAAMRAARNAIVGLGGYVGASSTSNNDDRPTAQITYRIPTNRWEDALDALRGLNGLTTKVAREDTQAVEVTGQVIDIQANIRNLQASERALQAIAEKATKISDVLEVQARLTDVRGGIERLTAELSHLEDQTSYGTLEVFFNTPIVAVEVAEDEWQPAKTVEAAAASLISVLQGLATAGIWFLIVWLPILAGLAVLTVGGAWVARRMGLHLPRRQSGPGEPVADGWR
jgi:hypothetical protein